MDRDDAHPRGHWYKPGEWGAYFRKVSPQVWAAAVIALLGAGGSTVVSEHRSSGRGRDVDVQLDAIYAELDSLWAADSMLFLSDKDQGRRLRRIERTIGVKRLREEGRVRPTARKVEPQGSVAGRIWRGLMTPLRLIAGGG